MSIFSPDIIQNESDIEAFKKREMLWKAMFDAACEIDKRGKNTSAYYIVCNEEIAEVWAGQYPVS